MSPKTNEKQVVDQLADQLEFHWTNQLRPRLDGLTDDEYFWCPVPNCWTVIPTVRSTSPTPSRSLRRSPRSRGGSRTSSSACWRCATTRTSTGRPRTTSWPYATDAATALRQLDDAYGKWIGGVRALTDDELNRPCGPPRGPTPTIRSAH